MQRFQRFVDVLDLDESALRSLLQGDGDAPERLWAAWALALRRRLGTGELLEETAGSEPSEVEVREALARPDDWYDEWFPGLELLPHLWRLTQKAP